MTRRRFLRHAGDVVALGSLSSGTLCERVFAFRQSSVLPDLPKLVGTMLYDEAALTQAATDQGRLVTRRPQAVLRPGSVEDVVQIVQYANARRLPIVMRGRGHSRSGLTLTDGGIVIDSRSLNKILQVTSDSIDAQAGCALSVLIAAGIEAGAALPVMTDCTMLSLGGFLSVGGQAQGSQRFGAFVDQVRELDVVTGDGRLVTCSESRERELFEMTLAGVGQCGIITRASLRAVRAPQQVITRTVTFDALEPFLSEQVRLLGSEQLDIMVGTILRRVGGGWEHVITVGGYEGGNGDADPMQFLAKNGSGVVSEAVRRNYQEYFNSRNVPLAPPPPSVSAAGAATRKRIPIASPALAIWLPASAARELVDGCLSAPEDVAGVNGIECTGLSTARFTRPLFRVPDEKHMFAFWTLRTVFADSGPTLETQLVANRKLLTRALAKGAKRYPPYGYAATAADWRAHYGEALYRRFHAAKMEYDPRGILTPGAGMFT